MCLITITITFYVAVSAFKTPSELVRPPVCALQDLPSHIWQWSEEHKTYLLSAPTDILILVTDRSLHTLGRYTQGLSSGSLSMSRLLIILVFTHLSYLDIQLLTFPPPPFTQWRPSGVAVEQCQRWALIRGICQRVEAVTGGWWELGVYTVKTVGNLTSAH